MIIPLKIESTRVRTKRNADNLHNDLNIMILNKRFTGIYTQPHTSLLDVTYGYKLKGELLYIYIYLFINPLTITMFVVIIC